MLYVDADMLLPPGTVTDLGARATDHAVLIGFRHNLRYGVAPDAGPELAADHRVTWRPPVNTPLLYSGITLREPIDTPSRSASFNRSKGRRVMFLTPGRGGV